ncbi:MAG TPA: DUF4907 domain-containing protein [Puia sp.]|nr:DUF4907 domain-containing protein [Puia sp.]
MLKYVSPIPVAAILVLLCSCRGTDRPAREVRTLAADSVYEVRVYATQGSGYGYAVYRHGRKMIDQPHIPVVQCLQAFATEMDARRVAGLVKRKLEENSFLPTVSLQELDSLGITYR